MSASCSRLSQSQGFTLVELVVFISIVTVALAGVMTALSYTNKFSPDPEVHKQALVIAEGLMQEIQQVPFTYCDPNDANAATATAYTDCAANSEQLLTGPSPNTESRYNQTNPFDNVADYGGFSMPDASCAGICRVGDATPISGLSGYTANVVLTNVGGTGSFPGLPADAVIQVAITVTGPANTTVLLKGYRVRYAPRI